MGPPEKRYFRLFSTQQQGDSKQNYLKLFDAIDEQEVYNEAVILEKFADEKFVKHFSQTKKYLYDNILKALKLFFADYCISVKLPDAIKDMRVLLNKGMVKPALKQYEKIENVFMVNEQFGALFDILNFGEQLWRATLNTEQGQKKVREIFQQKQMCLQYLGNLNEYIFLYNEIKYKYNKIFPARTPEEEEELKDFLEHPMLKAGNKTLSVHAEMKYYECLIMIYHGTSDFTKLRATCLEALKIMDKTEMNQYFTLDWHTMVYHRLLTAAMFLGDADFEKYKAEFEKYIDTYKFRVNLLDSINGQLRFHNAALSINFYRGEWDELFAHINSCSSFLETYWTILDPAVRADTALKLAQAFAVAGKYEAAMYWTEQIALEEKDFPIVSQVSWARQLRVLLNINQGNFTFLESLTRSTYRWLTKHGKAYETERALLKFANRTAKNEGFELQKHQTAFRRQLTKIFPQGKEKRYMIGLNILLWLKGNQNVQVPENLAKKMEEVLRAA